jgi:hypothetical protein
VATLAQVYGRRVNVAEENARFITSVRCLTCSDLWRHQLGLFYASVCMELNVSLMHLATWRFSS